MTSAASSPVAHFEDQDRQFANAYSILEDGVQQCVFPGASTAITQRGKLLGLKAFGRFTYAHNSPQVSTESVFDLASVSKVVATTAMAMSLYERNKLDLEAPVAAILPEFAADDAQKRGVTLRMLLAHSSGLPAYEKLFQRAHTRTALLREALAVPLQHPPGTHAEYSDIGFILLGAALERIAGEALDAFCNREVFVPLQAANTSFNPPPAWRERIVPTAEDKTFRKRTIQGEVQDENASVMGGVAGHAGVFSTADNLASFASAMLNEGAPVFRRSTVELFTRREVSPPGSSRALGWDTPSAPSQAGKYFSPNSFGHLGYTGTSLWIDAEREISVTLLTNRTWPDCSNQAIKQLRPRFHDAVMESLLGLKA
jgi:CubicO group peptidase (beta-lactamase class C family)